MRKLAMVFAMIAATIVSTAATPPDAPTSLQPKPLAPVQAKVQSAATERPAPTIGATPAAPLTAQDLSAWLDGYVPLALQKGEIAGAVVVIVKDGQILAEKGYGFADIDARRPVDPRRTLFRIGSVSKLFTWTAVMQLVEQGKIDLDADVNRYLDFKIPPRNGKPITMRNLMTHTPGFEEAIRALIITDPKGMSLERGVKTWTPTRVFDPGTTPAYSNYGVSLAGYIVQRVSGQPFDDYIEQHIFKPLQMSRTTFRQPLPKGWERDMSKGYQNASLPAKPFEIVTMPPAGSVSGTGSDMANFIIAHLQKGRFGDSQILRPETARMMHDTPTALMAPLNGIRLGFFDSNINGRRVIGHGGDTQYFHSNMLLFVDDGVGMFLSVNSSGVPNAGFRQNFFEAFADRYFPATPRDGQVDAKTAAEHATLIAGNYVSQRGAFSNFMAAGGLIGQLTVSANPDHTISISLLRKPSGQPRKYREIAPFLWREVGGHDRIGAIVKDGRVVRVSSDLLSGIMVFDRAPASINSAWLVPAVLAALGVLAITLVAWPIAAILRRRHKIPFGLSGRRKAAFLLVRLFAILALGAVVGWFALQDMFLGETGYDRIAKLDTLILALEALTLVGFVGGLIVAAWNLVAAWHGKAGWTTRLWYLLVTLAFLALSYFGLMGKLMNFSVNY